MAHTGRKLNMYEPTVYRICIQGELDQHWFEYFGAQSVTLSFDEAGNRMTTLISEPMDQGALVGLINRLNMLGVALVSLTATHRSDCRVADTTSDLHEV